MRARTGCQACRERHIKCVRDNATDKCQKCMENNRPCYQTSRHRFRPVTSVNFKTNDDRTIKQNLTYTPSQRWVAVPAKVKFIQDESFEISLEPDELPDAPSLLPDVQDLDYTTEDPIDVLLPTQSQPAVIVDEILPPTHTTTSTYARDDVDVPQADFLRMHVRSITNSHKAATRPSSRGLDQLFPSEDLLSPVSVPSFKPSWPFESQYEARLFAHYIKEISPWIDTTDPHAHFQQEVPRRVPYHPIIANAILALSSRHVALTTDTPEDPSAHYADKCLQMLMKSLDDPLAHWDENLLVAVVLLRLHEELSHDDDIRCHLFGTRKILDSISAFAADGGLREAAAWVSLRQHIYISLIHQQPLDLNLKNFTHSSIFHATNTTNEAWANRIIFIFSTILDFAFTSHATAPTTATWQSFRAQVDDWYDSKPWDFAPIWQDMDPDPLSNLPWTPTSVFTKDNTTTSTNTTTPPPSKNRTATATDNKQPTKIKPWPILLMCHRAQVTGLQYYHMSLLLLSIYDPSLTRLGFASHRARKASEKTVLEAIRNIVGLADSNPDYLNSMFEASHVLVTCGSYLQGQEERDAAVAFLGRVQRKAGWTTRRAIEELRGMWTGTP